MATKVKSRLTREQEEKLVRECYDNFPEASISLSCESWKYGKRDAFKFVFRDEDGKQYVVRMRDAVAGLRLFVEAVDSGKLPGLGLPAGYTKDTGLWDTSSFDALNQMAIFGEVIYG